MIQQPHQGYDVIKGSPLNILVFQQYQVYLNNVKMVADNNRVVISYPSDHVLLLPEMPDEVIEQLQKERKAIIWEINPHTGKVMERYEATI